MNQWRPRAATIILLGSVTGVGAAERAPDTMAERVRACAPCHGTQGKARKTRTSPDWQASRRGISTISCWHFEMAGVDILR